MNGKVGNGAAGGVLACIEGLPPLPKSLSGLLNSSGGSWRDMERMYVKKTMIQDDLSRGRNNADNLLANKPANLDAALALLRKEMVRLAECKQQLFSLTAGVLLTCQCLCLKSRALGFPPRQHVWTALTRIERF